MLDQDVFYRQLEKVSLHCLSKNEGIFGPKSMVWKINSYSLLMVIGMWRETLLELAHPWVANAIKDHSVTQHDPFGRFRRTKTILFTMYHGSLEQALQVSKKLFLLHQSIQGTIKESTELISEGTAYHANDEDALCWVYATIFENAAFLYETFIHPLSQEEKEKYFQESKLFAYLFGIPDHLLCNNWDDFIEYNHQMWQSQQLSVGQVGREMGQMLFKFKYPVIRQALPIIQLMTAHWLPEHLRHGFALPQKSKVNTAKAEKWIKIFKKCFNFAPNRLKYSPSFYEAQKRLKGDQTDYLTQSLNYLWFGRRKLVQISPSSSSLTKS